MSYSMVFSKHTLTKNLFTMCAYLGPFVQRFSDQFNELNVLHNCLIKEFVRPVSMEKETVQNTRELNSKFIHYYRHDLEPQKFTFKDDSWDLSNYEPEVDCAFWVLNIVDADVMHSQNKLTWSQELRTLLGYERTEDFPDGWDNWLTAIHPDDIEQTLETFNKHVNDKSGNTPYAAKYRIKNAYGDYIWIREHGNTIRNEQGLPLISLGAVRDVSEEM